MKGNGLKNTQCSHFVRLSIRICITALLNFTMQQKRLTDAEFQEHLS